MFVDRKMISQFDWGLFALSLIIPVIGLTVLYSAGYDPDFKVEIFNWLPVVVRSQVFLKQMVFFGIGTVVMLIAVLIPTQSLMKLSYLFYFLCLMLLVAVLFYGVISHGSRRWLAFGPYNLQPSEMMKIALILGLARYLSKNPPAKNSYGFSELLIPFAMFGLPMALIIRQPDLGTALSIGAIGFAMVLFMGIRLKAIAIMIAAVLVAAVPLWYSLHSYQKRRVLVLLNPDHDPQGSGWHIQQSKIAVGSGELFGKGYLQGTQTQLEFLPERTTDFIFCVLAEEGGFLACALVLAIYAYFVYRMLRVALRGKDLFSVLLAFGIATMIFVHATINIGMVIGLFPIVGLPLPLLSYGGSALLTNMFSIGLVLGAGMRRLMFTK